MRKKTVTYRRVLFTPEIIREALSEFVQLLPPKQRDSPRTSLDIDLSDDEEWLHDTEDEFFADYRRPFKYARFTKYFKGGTFAVTVSGYSDTRVEIELPNRAEVEGAFGAFEAHADECRIPEPTERQVRMDPKIFIGHGQSPLWRDLKDHLQDKQGYNVETYEVGPRAGFTIKEVLDHMLTSSSIAFLVLTAEDMDAAGREHARENVVHELGLFEGRLGWHKAIALLEEGVSEFSNIHGVNQIRFAKGQIELTYGEVVATIRREFPATG